MLAPARVITQIINFQSPVDGRSGGNSFAGIW
jgi:hypothetical protein